MRPVGLLHLYWLRLRSQAVQEGLALLGIAVGVALFSPPRSRSRASMARFASSSGLVGRSRLQLDARGPQGLPEAMFARVEKLAGVRSAAPVLEAPARVFGPSGSRSVELVAADPRFVQLGTLLRRVGAQALAHQRAVAVPAALAHELGSDSLETIRLQVAGKAVPVFLATVLQASEVGGLVQSPVVLAPLAYAQTISGLRGRVSRIFVEPAPGEERQVRRELERLAAGRLDVRSASYDATLFERAAMPINQSTGVFAAISALVGFLFAYNAMLLTVPARRRFVRELQLDGYGPWTLIEVLAFDALVLGVLACGVGLALGQLLSLHVFKASPEFLSFAFPVGSQRIVSWQAIAFAIAGGLLAAAVGVVLPLRDAISGASHRTQGHRSSRPAHLHAGMVVFGLVALAVTLVILLVDPGASIAAVVLLVAALLVLLPALLSAVIWMVGVVTRDVHAKAPAVALWELQSVWPRTVAVAATGALAVFASVAIQGAKADLQRGLDGSARAVSRAADVWIYPGGSANLLATSSFAPTAATALTRLPSVQAVRPYRGGFLDFGQRRVWISAPPVGQAEMVPAHQLVKGDLALANARLRQGGWAVISQAIASEEHLRIGQAFTLPAPRPTRFRVAGLAVTSAGRPARCSSTPATTPARGKQTTSAPTRSLPSPASLLPSYANRSSAVTSSAQP